jgi:hypothetical protein
MNNDADAGIAFEPLVRGRDLEPHFSFWMNELTARDLHDKADIAVVLAQLSRAISDIAPWLSASLESMTTCDAYVLACDQVFWAHRLSSPDTLRCDACGKTLAEHDGLLNCRVCRHGIRYPHECKACADDADPREIADFMRHEGLEP